MKPEDLAMRSLQMTEKQWAVLIATLEAGRGPTVPASRDRRSQDLKRYPLFRRAALRVKHPEGYATSHLVRTRNLSRGGISLVHACYLHQGTPCHVALQTRHGESVALAGQVSWCRHITGKSHEIGLRFNQVIQIDEFIDLQPSQAKNAAA